MHPAALKKLIRQDLKQAIVEANNNQQWNRVKYLKIQRWKLRKKLYDFNIKQQLT